MRGSLTVLGVLALFSSTTGCITGRVAELNHSMSRTRGEVLTATSTTADERGAPYAVVAREAECRVTPGDPEGGPGAKSYLLARSSPTDEEERFAKENGQTVVSAYRSGSDSEHAAPPGFPHAVVLAEGGEGPRLYLERPGGWTPLGVKRYVHKAHERGRPVLAGITTGLLLPPAIVADLVTWPFQWMLAPWFPVAPS